MNTPLPTTQNTPPPGWRWAPVFVLTFVALWPAPGYAEAVLVLGALAALIRLLLTRRTHAAHVLSARAWALTSVMFAAWWLPQLLSTFDAVDVQRTPLRALADLRYLPFLWLVAAAVSSPSGRRITFTGLALIALVWTLDGLAEALGQGGSPLFWGMDHLKHLISGREMCPNWADFSRNSGMFGPCNIKFGVVMASLSPFLLYAAARRFKIAGWAIAAALVGVVIVMSGMRASWLTYALVIALSGWQLLGWKKAVAALVGGAVVFSVLALSVPYVGQRLKATTAGLDSGTDVALAGRVKIWSAALCMYRQHSINGVGARSFRVAYPECDPNPEQRPEWAEGPAFHAHQIVLEILSETGTLGLLLWLNGVALAWRGWRFSTPAAREAARPAMLALAVTVFPFNTHLAFYSTFWGGLTLTLAALYVGSLLGHDPPRPAKS